MKLDFVFEGVTYGTGAPASEKYPRANVLVQADASDTSLPSHLALPSVRMSLPLTAEDLELPLVALRQRVIDTAKALLNEYALDDWLEPRSAKLQ